MAHELAPPARVRVAIATVCACGAVVSLVATALWSARAGLSTAVGAALAASNLWLLARIVGVVARPDRPRRAAMWQVLSLGKMLGLIVLAWLLLRSGLAQPLPLGLGYGALPVGIALGSVLSDRAERRTDAESRPDSSGPR